MPASHTSAPYRTSDSCDKPLHAPPHHMTCTQNPSATGPPNVGLIGAQLHTLFSPRHSKSPNLAPRQPHRYGIYNKTKALTRQPHRDNAYPKGRPKEDPRGTFHSHLHVAKIRISKPWNPNGGTIPTMKAGRSKIASSKANSLFSSHLVPLPRGSARGQEGLQPAEAPGH